MGAVEAMTLIGAAFVLISMYRALSCVERRYRRTWHRRRKRRGGKRNR